MDEIMISWFGVIYTPGMWLWLIYGFLCGGIGVFMGWAIWSKRKPKDSQ